MKLIVAGGTGLIGRLLVNRLLEVDHRVWVLSRNPEKARFPSAVGVVKWDGKTPAGWQPLVEQADAIINLSGENLGASRWTKRRLAQLRSSRIEPAEAILQAIREASHRPAVVLQSSAVGYYGAEKDQTLDEKSPPGSDPLAQLVVDWEDAIRPIEELGVRRVIARQGIVLDDREGALPRMLLPFRLLVGGPVGSGKQWISWISRRDIVEAMLFLLKADHASGVYNLTAPQPLTNADFGKTIAEVLRRPYWMPVPAFFLRALFGKMATIVLDGQRVLPARLLEAGYSFQHARLRSALEDLFSH